MNRLLVVVAFALLVSPRAVRGEDAASDEWIEAQDPAGKFSFRHPAGWGVEPWEKGGRRGTNVRPPDGAELGGALFGVEYYLDARVSAALSAEKIAKIYYDHYAGQGGKLEGEPEAVVVDGAPGVRQTFHVEVKEEVDGQEATFLLEYRVISVVKGGVAYVVNIAAERRILEPAEETCRRFVEGVRLSPGSE